MSVYNNLFSALLLFGARVGGSRFGSEGPRDMGGHRGKGTPGLGYPAGRPNRGLPDMVIPLSHALGPSQQVPPYLAVGLPFL